MFSIEGKIVLFSRYLDCVLLEPMNFKICDIIVTITTDTATFVSFFWTLKHSETFWYISLTYDRFPSHFYFNSWNFILMLGFFMIWRKWKY